MNRASFRAFFHTALIACGLVCPASADEVRVWNFEVCGDASLVAAPAALGPIVIEGARNGVFSGAVAVESKSPIAGLKAVASPLTGPAVIPADRLAVRYAVSWETVGGGPGGLDILLESPPATIPVSKNRALAGVWVSVNVPPDAKAGLYRGTLSVEAEGMPVQSVPVELTVSDWTLPDSQNWRTWVEMIQSPDTLAMEYGVPMWSEKHWALIAKSFRLIKETGSRVVYVPILRNTNQGNEESMVRWVRQRDGTLKPDYAVMERYLDTAQKHLGGIKLVVFYVWDSYLTRSYRGQSYETKPETPGPAMERWELLQKGLTVTMLNEETGRTETGFLPHYTAPESRALWQPVYDELRKRMRARGLEQAMALGIVCDMEPSKEEVRFLHEVSGGLPWIAHSHFSRINNKPLPNTALHGIAGICYEAHAGKAYQVNPEKGRLFGWQVPELRAELNRFNELNGPCLRVRQVPQLNITGRQRGIGRLGGDFWQVIRNNRGQRAFQVFERYPENHWRGLNIGCWFLAPGPDGPVATARLENLREGVQECEARISIESVLVDPEKTALIGADLASRAQKMLDEHQRAVWRSIWSNEEHLAMMGAISGRNTYEAIWGALARAGVPMPDFWAGEARTLRSTEDRKGIEWFVASGWKERTRHLFEIAGEIQRRLK